MDHSNDRFIEIASFNVYMHAAELIMIFLVQYCTLPFEQNSNQNIDDSRNTIL